MQRDGTHRRARTMSGACALGDYGVLAATISIRFDLGGYGEQRTAAIEVNINMRLLIGYDGSDSADAALSEQGC